MYKRFGQLKPGERFYFACEPGPCVREEHGYHPAAEPDKWGIARDDELVIVANPWTEWLIRRLITWGLV